MFTWTQNCWIPFESKEILVGNGELLLKIRELSIHTQLEDLTLPGRQKANTVLGWRRQQSLSQQQFTSQVPGVKSQTQTGRTGKRSTVLFPGAEGVTRAESTVESSGPAEEAAVPSEEGWRVPPGVPGVPGPGTEEVGAVSDGEADD